MPFDQDPHTLVAKTAGSSLLTDLIKGLKSKTRSFDKGSTSEHFESGCRELGSDPVCRRYRVTMRDRCSMEAAAAMRPEARNLGYLGLLPRHDRATAFSDHVLGFELAINQGWSTMFLRDRCGPCEAGG